MDTSPPTIPAVILTGGSELVSAAVARALSSRGVPLVIVSLLRDSSLRDIVPRSKYHEMTWPPSSVGGARDQLRLIMTRLGAGRPQPWPIFATEDGGLRLLQEGRREFAQALAVFGARALQLGGLDKAELFTFLEDKGLSHLIAPTRVVSSPSQLATLLGVFGQDAVFKPALKPHSMDLRSIGAKVVSAAPGETFESLSRRLNIAWSIADTWIAQPRLSSTVDGEAVWWGFRGRGGECFGTMAFERRKYPAMGGSGCWVETTSNTELNAAAEELLSTLDFHGPVELPFLKDAAGQWRLLELNPRPWLQAELAEQAGFPIIFSSYCSATGNTPPVPDAKAIPTCWVSPERMIAAAMSITNGSRMRALYQAVVVISRADCRPPYDVGIPQFKRRWVGRMLRRAGEWMLR